MHFPQFAAIFDSPCPWVNLCNLLFLLAERVASILGVESICFWIYCLFLIQFLKLIEFVSYAKLRQLGIKPIQLNSVLGVTLLKIFKFISITCIQFDRNIIRIKLKLAFKIYIFPYRNRLKYLLKKSLEIKEVLVVICTVNTIRSNTSKSNVFLCLKLKQAIVI